jgi:hypothetical protein
VSFSSANIPAVSFAITADLPSRCHQRNQANGHAAGFDVLAVGQKPDRKARFVTSNPCQAFELLIKAVLQIIRNCKYGWG